MTVENRGPDFVARTADSVHRMVSDPSSPPKELTMETGQYLVLSTAHIRCATGQILTAWADYPPHKQPLPVAPTQYGWFLHTMTPPPEAQRRLPKELPPILAFGRDNGCDYVLLDSDGPTEDLLPTFPW